MKQSSWCWGPEPQSLQIAGLTLEPDSFKDDGRILVAVHGWLDNGASFLPLARCNRGRAVWHLLDLPGHGHSQWAPAGQVYHFIDWIAYLAAYLDQNFQRPVTLVGHSMGAGIAPLLAVARPDKVDSLILLDGLGPLSSQPEKAPEILREALAKPWPAIPEPARPFASLEQAAQVLAKPRNLEPHQILDLAQRAVEQLDGCYRLRHDPRLKFPSRLRITEQQTCAFLSALEQPTLLIVPKRGYFTQAPEWQARQPLVRALSMREIDGGHHVHLETPQLVDSLIWDWLDEIA